MMFPDRPERLPTDREDKSFKWLTSRLKRIEAVFNG